MGREVRLVPKNWQHPRDAQGEFIPLFEYQDYLDRLHMFHDFLKQWKKGELSLIDLAQDLANENLPPCKHDYMPNFELGTATHYILYENTSEGTPISPAFETKEELVQWLVDNEISWFAQFTASYDEWMALIDGVLSGMVAINTATGEVKPA